MRKLLVAAAGLTAVLALAGRVRSYPKDYGPFAEGQAPRPFRVYPCKALRPEAAPSAPAPAGEATRARAVPTSAGDPKEKASVVASATFARGDRGRRSALIRLEGEGRGRPVLMTVLDPEGRTLAGPRRISDFCVRVLPPFWADMNGDGVEDFVVFVVTPCGKIVSGCDVAFALSSPPAAATAPAEGPSPATSAASAERSPEQAAGSAGREGAGRAAGGEGDRPGEGGGPRYRITALRPTLSPGASDFVDLGDGRCRFVHTVLVTGTAETSTDGRPHSHWVYNLLEFEGAPPAGGDPSAEGGRVAVSSADERFPMWVWYTHRPNHEATALMTPEQKDRLWAAVPERIFRRPPAARVPADSEEVALTE